MHCQNSKFWLNKQFGIRWKPFAASTASSVVRGFWINLPLHFVHLDINWSSLIFSWNISITCKNIRNFSYKNTASSLWLMIAALSCLKLANRRTKHTSSSCSFFRRLFTLYIWFFNIYWCLSSLASRVNSTLFSLWAWPISSLHTMKATVLHKHKLTSNTKLDN